MDGSLVFFDNYSLVGDIIVIATVVVMTILIFTSFVKRTRSFLLFLSMIFLIVVASFSNILYHLLFMDMVSVNNLIIYVFRYLFHFSLYLFLLFYILYVADILQLEKHRKIWFSLLGIFGVVAMMVVELIGSIKGFGFRIGVQGATKGAVLEGFNLFIIGYVYFCLVIIYMMFRYKDRLFGQIMSGFYGTMVVSFILVALQVRSGQTSFITASFAFPLLAMMYLIHSNPYDLRVGSISSGALEDLVKYYYEHGREFIIMTLYLRRFDEEEQKFPESINKTIRQFAGKFFKGAVLFQVSNGHVILMADKRKNPDFENKTNKLLNDFLEQYEIYHFDYKIVIGDSLEEISRRNEYISFIKHIYTMMPENDVHFIEYEDVTDFNKEKYILDELGDIYRRRDLNDSRVSVYCQPVLNRKTGKYDTAEALMRLSLPQIGLVFPNQFIQLAEQNNYIHVLSLIILNKTCAEIKRLLSEGYELSRISINISVLEMRDDNFCSDIKKIISDSGIPEDKIAIEITESQNENDFYIMKSRINELKCFGIKFYLDDFGTGYSNLERIMELPFDIIKFDRSLVIASGDSRKSEKMVGNLAHMFSDMDYSVLYEGVENDMDEERCINMSAVYLQGYKYSRPIPMEQLSEFFEKKVD